MQYNPDLRWLIQWVLIYANSEKRIHTDSWPHKDGPICASKAKKQRVSVWMCLDSVSSECIRQNVNT